MARGGYRAGAGRPRKHPVIQLASSQGEVIPPRDQPLVGATIDEHGELILPSGWVSPLGHLLAVLNDPTIDGHRRDRAAIAALPFVHDRKLGIYQSSRMLEHRQADDAVVAPGPWKGVLRTAD